MDITGVIKIEENDTYRYDNKEDNGVSLVMIHSDEPLTMDEDENIYFENNPQLLGVFISKYNLPLLEKILDLIDEYEVTLETRNIKSKFVIDKDTTAEFIPDNELVNRLMMNPCFNNPLHLVSEYDNKEDL